MLYCVHQMPNGFDGILVFNGTGWQFLGIGGAACSRGVVIGREDAADKRNHDDPGAAVIRDAVDVPPAIAVIGHRDVERRSIGVRKGRFRCLHRANIALNRRPGTHLRS